MLKFDSFIILNYGIYTASWGLGGQSLKYTFISLDIQIDISMILCPFIFLELFYIEGLLKFLMLKRQSGWEIK